MYDTQVIAHEHWPDTDWCVTLAADRTMCKLCCVKKI